MIRDAGVFFLCTDFRRGCGCECRCAHVRWSAEAEFADEVKRQRRRQVAALQGGYGSRRLFVVPGYRMEARGAERQSAGEYGRAL